MHRNLNIRTKMSVSSTMSHELKDCSTVSGLRVVIKTFVVSIAAVGLATRVGRTQLTTFFARDHLTVGDHAGKPQQRRTVIGRPGLHQLYRDVTLQPSVMRCRESIMKEIYPGYSEILQLKTQDLKCRSRPMENTCAECGNDDPRNARLLEKILNSIRTESLH